ncbi:hypothetical protein A1OE_282 [Candidatus Endolissoclinum faulkneri L2]|uniref:Uncharacterized protein n=1 Tax=Candidatus Endolissoclinum faulkneri L2 TaxID=1193729 RepID=K7YLX9_9PROT|nr:hypothetical protein A1OE_282 [Candidatus Endolissoclinum faulkneri L2]
MQSSLNRLFFHLKKILIMSMYIGACIQVLTRKYFKLMANKCCIGKIQFKN